MERHRENIVTTEEVFDWSFDNNIEVRRNTPKTAFFAGLPLKNYLDDPGFSRFSNTFCLPYPECTVDFKYTPSEDRLIKPVYSKLGYGIGGLCAARFAEHLKSDNSAPNAYHDHLFYDAVKRGERAKKAEWKEFEENYERLVEQCTHHESYWNANPTGGYFELSRGQRNTAVDVSLKEPKKNPCTTRTTAFGTSLNFPRFSQRSLSKTPGAGSYEPSLIPRGSSFQITNPNGRLLPSVRTVCLPGTCDICMSCGNDLIHSDYYQTKDKFKKMITADPMTYGRFKKSYLSFCRACYCKALLHGYDPWRKGKIPELFMKARHCNSVHDHQGGHLEFLTKVTCKEMLKLARKELLYRRYFKDIPGHKVK